MSDRNPGSRLLWWAAVVVVPLALAGIALIWPGARITEDVRQRAMEALAGAGLGDVSVQADTVRRIAELLRGTSARVLLDGYVADAPGPPATAQRLSEQRAAVVAEALPAGGVDPTRITARGLGDRRPLATEAASRRVEISLEEG